MVPPILGAVPISNRAPGVKGGYDLMSYGKDGQPGGSGDSADPPVPI